METLFVILLLLSLGVMLVGLVVPSKVRLDSRKRVAQVFGGTSLVFFIILAIVADPVTETAPIAEVVAQNPAPVVETESSPAKQPRSLEERITIALNNALGSTNNTDKPRVVSVKVDSYNSVELSAYGYAPTDVVKGVLITINSSENLTANLQKGTMADEATKVFQAVFPLSQEIGDVAIWSQLPVKDQYGNTKDGTAITFVMARPLYQKINWTNLNHRDLPNLLNTESRIDDRNGSHELIRF